MNPLISDNPSKCSLHPPTTRRPLEDKADDATRAKPTPPDSATPPPPSTSPISSHSRSVFTSRRTSLTSDRRRRRHPLGAMTARWSLVLIALAVATASCEPGCPPDQLLVYRVVMHTAWSRERFPRHFPEWRPAAQWSPLFGMSHSANYVVFRLGLRASAGVKQLAETGRWDGSSPGPGVWDEFSGPAVGTGVGRSEARFTVTGNHSRVSLMSKITPSPDWFIGVDSLELCVNGRWIDHITVEADPLDAGTDNGFTFTAPRWPTEPPGVIYHVTSHFPAHPAGSFYYPHLMRLPPIATIQFIKMREYELSKSVRHDDVTDIPIDIDTTPLPSTTASPETGAILTSIVHSYAKERRHHKFRMKLQRHNDTKPPRDCRVSEWSAWGSCSEPCGIGETTRSREVVARPRRGGRACPPTRQARWCAGPAVCPPEW